MVITNKYLKQGNLSESSYVGGLLGFESVSARTIKSLPSATLI